jgi:hypothetical protein
MAIGFDLRGRGTYTLRKIMWILTQGLFVSEVGEGALVAYV